MTIIRYNSLHHSLNFSIINPNHSSNKSLARNSSKLLMMCASNHQSLKLQIRSSHKIKIFEDRSSGIVCYRDENGEIMCEGYDEGPRFHHQISRFNTGNSSDAEIIDLLQRCWFHVSDEHELVIADEGEQADFNCNGFNKLF